MAKKKSYKGKKQYGVYAVEGRLEKNRKARRARHLKKHPNDKQSQKMAGVKVKSPSNVKGNFPEKKVYAYDGAGRKTLVNYNTEY